MPLNVRATTNTVMPFCFVALYSKALASWEVDGRIEINPSRCGALSLYAAYTNCSIGCTAFHRQSDRSPPTRRQLAILHYSVAQYRFHYAKTNKCHTLLHSSYSSFLSACLAKQIKDTPPHALKSSSKARVLDLVKSFASAAKIKKLEINAPESARIRKRASPLRCVLLTCADSLPPKQSAAGALLLLPTKYADAPICKEDFVRAWLTLRHPQKTT